MQVFVTLSNCSFHQLIQYHCNRLQLSKWAGSTSTLYLALVCNTSLIWPQLTKSRYIWNTSETISNLLEQQYHPHIVPQGFHNRNEKSSPLYMEAQCTSEKWDSCKSVIQHEADASTFNAFNSWLWQPNTVSNAPTVSGNDPNRIFLCSTLLSTHLCWFI